MPGGGWRHVLSLDGINVCRGLIKYLHVVLWKVVLVKR
jgi:hypothetical protein